MISLVECFDLLRSIMPRRAYAQTLEVFSSPYARLKYKHVKMPQLVNKICSQHDCSKSVHEQVVTLLLLHQAATKPKRVEKHLTRRPSFAVKIGRSRLRKSSATLYRLGHEGRSV